MRPILFITLVITCLLQAGKTSAQMTKNYETEWKKIDELFYKKNLPQTALAEVKKIYTQAKKERQDAQVIKALVYMISLQQENREENYSKGISELEKEVKTSKEPVASILKSMQANLYWQYFQNNRWKLYDRTNTVNFNKSDIATWTADDLHKKISDLYLQSIGNDVVLKKTKLEPFDAIIVQGNVRYLRPTLYDLLANEALEYFKNDERDISKPSYSFEIDQSEAFASAESFITAKFTTKDSLSLHYKALLIYQDLLSFHLNDEKKDALIDADIQRLEFVYQNSVSPNKDSLYQQALQNITAHNSNNPIATQAWYLQAAYHEKLAATYHPFQDTTYRYEHLKAKEILERVVRDSAVKTEGWANSYNLLVQITKPSFSFKTEKVNVPEKPFRTLVAYRNLSSLDFKVILVDESIRKLWENRYNDQFWNALIKSKPIKTWHQSLPNTNDLQEHSIEIKVDALPTGEYLLLASSNSKDLRAGSSPLGAGGVNGPMAVSRFYVSNISYVQQSSQYFVLHRETGQPLANAVVQVFAQQYNYQLSKYSKVKYASYKTDKNGFFEIEDKKEEKQRHRNLTLDITYKNDHLSLDEPDYIYYSNIRDEEAQVPNRIFFFTDRSIYRPGQTVFFKGIAINKKQIVPGYSTTIFLKDGNWQNVDSLELTTNEFGSFSGKFTLPQNLLNGAFQITDKEGRNNASFSVEEYKRPKFYVDFDKVEESYKVGDSITVKGSAKAYAGNNINGAKVVYRVVRQSRFLYPWLWKGWWPRAEPMEIAHGELETDASGQFAFAFKAIPDLKLDKKLDPSFDYEVSVDITDINGETRSGNTNIAAGYKSLILKVTLDERVAIDSFNNINIRTENRSGAYQPSMVSVMIHKLIPENRLIRNRYWQQPDLFMMSKEEFLRFFPNDEYNNESDYRNWQVGEQVFEKTDSTRIDGHWSIGDKQWAKSNGQDGIGFYKIEITTSDKDGEEVKDVRFFELFDSKNNKLSTPVYLWTKGNTNPIEPGEKTSLQLGTAAQNVFLVQQVQKIGQEGDGKRQLPANRFSFINMDNEKRSFEFSANEEDRGGYGVSFFFIKDNRFYSFDNTVNVPWSNKELNIEYATFRDKTLPGSEEKWMVKISGYKGEKLAAEMLASMYDASLDQFNPHNWRKPDVWPVYGSFRHWNGLRNFGENTSQEKPLNDIEYKSFNKLYDQLINSPQEKNVRYNRGRKEYYPSDVVTLQGKRDMGLAAPPIVESQEASRALAKVAAPVVKGEAAGVADSLMVPANATSPGEPASNQPPFAPATRKNFNETAFFFPDLHTDKDGNIEFSFTMPEALTRWKLQTFAHSKELAMAFSQKEVITQKELMVQPNMPRFLRQGDRMELSVKIVNLSEKELTGQAELQLLDASTNQSVDGWFQNVFPNQYFTVAAGSSEVVKFPIEVPYQFTNALVWRVVAKASSTTGGEQAGAATSFSDGEEMTIPVLTNKVLVTETLPLPMRSAGTKTFTFDKLLKSANSETLQHQSLSVEFTSNPAWYAVQALPFLMEAPHECADQIFNRYYANALAARIVAAAPRVKEIFERWKTMDSSALLSNLQKNQELKSVLLEETPWVLQAKTEEQQKKNIALLFNLVRMESELKGNLQKLQEMQSENGGFVWFKGGPDDRYMTQYILTGIGHLVKLKAINRNNNSALDGMIKKALAYLDRKTKEDYDRLVKRKADLKKQHIGYTEAQYLYMRSFFAGEPIPPSTQTAYNYYQAQARQFWMKGNKYMQGMIALALNRMGDKQTPPAILRSLKETAIVNEEMGMYWKDAGFRLGWFWWQAPIETQSLMIEVFAEISKDDNTIDNLKTWLLKNKQTNNWRTTKATADACYALLLQGTDWLSNNPQVTLQLGSTKITSGNNDAEAGTGYFKRTIDPKTISAEMGNISASVQPSAHTQPAKQLSSTWGAVYWQYFEDADKITPASTPLQLNKKLFVQKNTDNGPVLSPVEEGSIVKVGDRIVVRIELRVDRDMEYVHMKDLRASALEPVNVLSSYKWQGGMGYYESTKDASTNFFFNYLRKGTYVFEYPLFVAHAGDFSNGITSIQCMYAPEFSAHSEGVRLKSE